MISKRFFPTLIKAVVSTLCAGITYFAWLAVFLLTTNSHSPMIEIAFWLLTPILTALGFAAGLALVESRTRPKPRNFLKTFLWPLVGCSLGAIAVYWFGPMLIVFGMFACGVLSVLLREQVQHRGQT